MPWVGVSLVLELLSSLSRRLVSNDLQEKLKDALVAVHNKDASEIEIFYVEPVSGEIYNVGYAVKTEQEPQIDAEFQQRFIEAAAAQLGNQTVKLVAYELLEPEQNATNAPTTTPLEVDFGNMCKISMGIATVTLLTYLV